jgi:hypothetical protein
MQLPASVVKGQEFNVIVRRISTRWIQLPGPEPIIQTGSTKAPSVIADRTAAAESQAGEIAERYVVGTFQIRVPVKTRTAILPAEETRLAIFKARLAAMPTSDRWHPVLARYIELLSERVHGLGGDPGAIPPSFGGYPPGKERGRPEHPPERRELAGKVSEVLFDCCGKFEGFVLRSCEHQHRIAACEPAIMELVLRACRERLELLVTIEGSRIRRIQVVCC